MQVAYFATKLIEHDPEDVPVRSRVMVTLLMTPRLFINACFDKVKMILMPTLFEIFQKVLMKFAHTFTAGRKNILVFYISCVCRRATFA
jgi:hypothetical protein